MTFSDRYSSTLVVDALLRTRDATINPLATGPLEPARAVVAPSVARWDPWVRVVLGVQGLLEGLRFEVTPLPEGDAAHAPAEGYAHALDAAMQMRAVALYASPGVDLPVVSLRRPTQAVFDVQLSQVLDWAELRGERATEVLAQIDNQHAFFGAIVPFHTGRMRKTAELVELVTQFAVFIETRMKHELACGRPNLMSPQVQPMITTPGHGALPSGHCTQAYIIAYLLGRLIGTGPGDDRHTQLQRLAARIAVNRTVAGLHYPVDNLAGRLLGTSLGEYAVSRLSGQPAAWVPRAFDGHEVQGSDEFLPQAQTLPPGPAGVPNFYLPWGVLAGDLPPLASALRELWRAAEDECADLG
ncbi:MAG: PA-phosphatase [Rubrivivax sp.]|nr:PA-phosphatase [Rubrivivax sp.]